MPETSYEFTPLSQVPVLDTPTDQTHIYVEDGGQTRRVPVGEVTGGKVFLIDTTAEDYAPTNTEYGNTIKEALLRGDTLWLFDGTAYSAVDGFAITENTTGDVFLEILCATKASTTSSIGVASSDISNIFSFAITMQL